MPELHIPLGTLGFVVAQAGLAVDVSDGRTGVSTQTRTTASTNRSLSRRLGARSSPSVEMDDRLSPFALRRLWPNTMKKSK